MQVFLITPRGFCAGVKRAVDIVHGAILKYGNSKEIYVKHEIVHNKYVVEHFRKQGVKFVQTIEEVPKGAVIIFSAHGVAENVEIQAKDKDLHIIDATCPLVKKVHRMAQKHDNDGKQIILIGHKNHPEVEGTIGRISNNGLSQVVIIENESEVDNLVVKDPTKLAYITQTTLSIDDTAGIIFKLKAKFPDITFQDESDICYATQNRQDAVKNAINTIENLDLLLVIGSLKSSNSNRLKDIGAARGIRSFLINSVADLTPELLANSTKIAVTSGASAPEILVQEVVRYLLTNFNASLTELEGVEENIEFHVPKDVRISPSNLY